MVASKQSIWTPLYSPYFFKVEVYPENYGEHIMSIVPAEPITGAAEHEIAGRSLTWWGMIFFIASEALIFANLIAAYLYLEFGVTARACSGSCPMVSIWISLSR